MPGVRTAPLKTKLDEYRQFLQLVGAVMKRWRRIRRLSQRGLASMVGVTPVFIRYIESGRRSVSLEVAFYIANALNISIGSLCPMLRVKLAAQKPVRKKTAQIPMRSAVVRERAEAAKRKAIAA